MSQFLVGEELSGAIKKLLASPNVRCAVAFWGNGAVRNLFGNTKTADGSPRVICDISMGCTSPFELEELGAPGNSLLKYIPGLHAKVYISDAGVIISSANASSNGIGWAKEDPAHLIEAGTLHDKGSLVWEEASIWFDRLHNEEAQIVDQAALSYAQKLWDARPPGGWPPLVGPASLLTLVRTEPHRLSGTGFVFVTTPNSPENIKNAKRSAIRGRPELKKEIADWSPDNMFCDWTEEDVEEWPRRFVMFWKPKPNSPLTMMAHIGVYYSWDGKLGNVFAAPPDWKTFANGIGKEHLLPKYKCETLDAALAERVIDEFCTDEKEGKLFPTAAHLAEALKKLEEDSHRR